MEKLRTVSPKISRTSTVPLFFVWAFPVFT